MVRKFKNSKARNSSIKFNFVKRYTATGTMKNDAFLWFLIKKNNPTNNSPNIACLDPVDRIITSSGINSKFTTRCLLNKNNMAKTDKTFPTC